MTAGETMSAPGQMWSCTSCGCLLVLRAGAVGDPAWFEHDTRIVARNVLMNCAHFEPEVKAEARYRGLRYAQRTGCHGADAVLILRMVR